MRLIFYAGAALPQDLWERLEAAAVRTTGKRIPMSSSWGTTETAPLATAAHFLLDRAGNIGVPVPGVEVKLLPNGGKLEIRVRGPNITPGYWKRPDLTAAAFDEDGFYKPGDAVRFAHEDDLEVEWERISNIEPIPFDERLIELADQSITEIAGSSHRLPSGPLHDAAEVARAGVPTVMLFVQSLRGLSHTKLEDTKEEHLELSVQALDRLAQKAIQTL